MKGGEEVSPVKRDLRKPREFQHKGKRATTSQKEGVIRHGKDDINWPGVKRQEISARDGE